MKKILVLIVLICIGCTVKSQNIDSLKVYGNKISDAFSRSDYTEVVRLTGSALIVFDKLDEKLQKDYERMKAGIYYNQACGYARLGKKNQAVNSFTQAIDYGYIEYLHAKSDPDLESLAKDKAFKKQLLRIKEEGDFIYILQKAEKYLNEPAYQYPAFTYQNPDNENLVRVRKYFNLDSIAGDGDEISRIKNLMYWVHDVVRLDGNSSNPRLRNAIDLVEICRNENRGVNCRQMAIILNECYLAMGFKSRFITCMPRSESDPDCHVINSVYAVSLNKWIWMDPTFAAYVSDDKGNLLSIREVRERLIHNKPLVLNEDANWNHKGRQTKEAYLDSYMAKNLYWFECSLWSDFDTETRDKDKKYSPYIRLCPDGFKFKQFRESTLETSNPDYFWKSPL